MLKLLEPFNLGGKLRRRGRTLRYYHAIIRHGGDGPGATFAARPIGEHPNGYAALQAAERSCLEGETAMGVCQPSKSPEEIRKKRRAHAQRHGLPMPKG